VTLEIPPRILGQLYAFSDLDPDRLRQLASLASVRTFEPAALIVRRTEPADAWHIVASGKVRAADEAASGQGLPLLLAPGDGFGEQSLLGGWPWPYTLRADGPATVVMLPRLAFDTFANALPPDERRRLRQRIERQADFDFLRRLNLFAHLTPARTARLFEQLERTTLERGAYLFHENAPSHSCFIVRRGRLRLMTTVGQSRRQLAIRRDGDFIGEIELLYGTPRMADAIADADCEVFAIPSALFDELTPDERARHALYQLATDRLLQYQNALSGDDTRDGQDALPSLSVRWATIKGRVFSRSYPFVAADTPMAAGLACLAMIDSHHGRDGVWQERLEQLLWDRTPDTLLTLSRKAEQCGYLTHLVSVSPARLADVSLPAVIEDTDGSLAVLYRATRVQAVVANPATGVRCEDLASLGRAWSGRMLTLSAPAPDLRRALLAEYAPALAAVAIVSLLTLVFGVGGPLASGWIIDRVLVDGDQSLLQLLLLGMLVLLTFHVTAGGLREYLVAHACGRITLGLQLRFFDHVLRLPPSTSAAIRVGDLAVRFRENDALVRHAFQAGFHVIVDPIGVIAHLALLALISLPLAGVALLFALAHAGLMLVASPFMRRIGRRRLDTHGALRSHIIETVAGLPTIKTLVLEPFFLAHGRTLMRRRKADEFDEARLSANLELTGRVLQAAAILALLAVGAVLTLDGSATTGRMVAAVGIYGAMMVPLGGLLRSRDALRDARQSFEHLAAILDLDTEDGGTTTVAPVLQGHVVFRQVSFRYPGSLDDALTDVSFDVLPGQKVALVGRSGSGKTTLFNLLMGLYPPTRGAIFLDQIDIGSIPKADLRRQLGVVEQHPFLFEGTVCENIAQTDPAAPLDEIVAAARMAGAHEFIEALPAGYDTRIGERGAMLSGGERQRLVIARALAGRPRMLLLDEATSAIDSRMERAIHSQIAASQDRRTMFVIAHRLSTVRDADLIVVLDQGRVIDTGSHADLMARRGLYWYLNTRSA